ncbi:hypothetical protein BBP40_004929 [Aspergillus hancockii]|nr:hypothetical protein BBP40_004929 [Aspergillus hancockii]
MAVANGLLSTLGLGTSTGKWIRYQILLGTARGLSVQLPILAVQNALPPTQVPIATTLVMFSQIFSASLFLSFSNTIFTNSLTTLIPRYAPLVDPQAVIDAGATGLSTWSLWTAAGQRLDCICQEGRTRLCLTTGMASKCVLFSCAMGWKDIRKKNTVSEA